MDGQKDGIGGNDLKLGAVCVKWGVVISRNLVLLATVFRRLARSRGRRRRVKLAVGLDRANSHSLRYNVTEPKMSQIRPGEPE